ncbi:monocarboxylate transporter 13-like [Asterias amurensis]|uniref:monocarboxylate transporter 13-like n=1 Tax=Asterias amurensis TaxID=7602 RepID=UPI003AB3D001
MIPVSDDHQSQLNVAQQDPNHGAASSTVTIEHLPANSTLQPRTDTGWAWVVLLGAVVVNFVAFGASASLSVYLNVWMEYFDVSAVTVGFVLSFRTLIKTLMGPVSAAICTKFGPRVTMMVGGVALVGGYAMATCSPTVWILILSNGVLTAFGSSLSRVASFQALSVYFKKRFTFAVGLASVGLGVKQLVCPPLYTYLIDLYGWQGSMLLIAGVSFHVVAAGALLRPITLRKTTLGLEEVTDDSCNTSATTEADVSPGLDSQFANSSSNIEDTGGDSDTKPSSVGYVKRHYFALKHFMLETYGIRRLAHNSAFVILMVVSVCHGFGKLGLVYSVVRAESVGIEPNLAALILSLMGGGSTIAVAAHGWFVDKKYITAELAYSIGALLYGVLAALTPAFVTFVPLAIIAVPMGMVTGMTGSLITVIVCSHVKKTDTAGAFGAHLFFWGIGEIAGVFVAGFMYDSLGSYDFAFFIGGGALLIASMLTFVMHVTQRSKQRRQEIATVESCAKATVEICAEATVENCAKATVENCAEATVENCAEATVENYAEPSDFPTNVCGAQSEERGISNPAYVLTSDDESSEYSVT